MRGLYQVFFALYIFLRLITAAIVIYCVLSWFRPRFRAFDWLRGFIQPFLAPFQKLSMKAARHFSAPIDFTCLFALIGYQVLPRLLWWLYGLLVRLL